MPARPSLPERDQVIELPGLHGLRAYENAPMSRYTTWRIGGPADVLVRTGTPSELTQAVRWGRGQGLAVTVLGGGSNLLVGDGGIRGLVIVSRTPGQRAERLFTAEDHGDFVRVRVAAHAPLSWVGRCCSEHGWAGMDWGVGLPGTIGGATVNNAGAHGTEQIDHLHSVELLDESGDNLHVESDWLQAAYRFTTLKSGERPRPYTVLEAVLELPKSDPAELKQLADEHADYRHRTQPTGRCAGSTFSNPPGDFAGRLIEAAGLKEYAVGGVQFSTIHANFIVNDGTATAAHVRELIAYAQNRVRTMFGVELAPEIEEIGEP